MELKDRRGIVGITLLLRLSLILFALAVDDYHLLNE